MLEIVQVSVGQPAPIGQWKGRDVYSAIRKRPVLGDCVRLTDEGLEGDVQADPRVHGGPVQAVYAYPFEHYTPWEGELGLELSPPDFGENLTVAGALEHEIRIGDEFTCGDVLLKVTKPRRPCRKLCIHLGVEDIAGRMMRTLRSGWYFRVVSGGLLPTSGTLYLVGSDHTQPTVAQVFAAKVKDDPTVPDISDDA